MRPKIICHMVSTIDGRISGERRSTPDGNISAKVIVNKHYETANQFNADVELLGRKTVQESFVKGAFESTGMAWQRQLVCSYCCSRPL